MCSIHINQRVAGHLQTYKFKEPRSNGDQFFFPPQATRNEWNNRIFLEYYYLSILAILFY